MNTPYLNVFPEILVNRVSSALEEHRCTLKIVNPRKTKRGDFRVLKSGYQITVNKDVNKYRFLFTLMHEIAHLLTYVKYRNKVKPHGKEWKMQFSSLMYEWNAIEVFSADSQLLEAVEYELHNPKACSGVGTSLERALRVYDHRRGVLLEELQPNTAFEFRGVHYVKMHKRRTRALCLRLDNKRKYTISLAADVVPI